jgi:alcohol dehydrogenase class IV
VSRFEFATATRIVFGIGTRAELPGIVRGFGQRALFVCGSRGADAAGRDAVTGPAEPSLLAHVRAAGVAGVQWAIGHEPTVDDVRAAVVQARADGCEVVVAVGGGSVIDAGKAVAALVPNGEDPLEFLEVIGAGRALTRPSLPFVAVPTTAGSGAEVTRNAVLGSPTAGVKASLRSASMLPKVALVDPELTRSLPPALTASTGLDALAQLIEPYLSRRATPFTDMFCADGIPRVVRALPTAFDDGTRLDAREDMAWASVLGGLALANAGLGAVHGFAGPIGGRFTAPHGAVCAALLAPALRVNVRAMRARDGENPSLGRAETLASWLTGRSDATPEDACRWIERLCDRLRVARLGAYGLGVADVPPLVEQARRASSMQGNPIVLTDDELAEILTAAL